MVKRLLMTWLVSKSTYSNRRFIWSCNSLSCELTFFSSISLTFCMIFLAECIPLDSNVLWFKDPKRICGYGCNESASAEIAFISKYFVKEEFFEFIENIVEVYWTWNWVPFCEVWSLCFLSIQTQHHITINDYHILEGGKEVLVRAWYLLLHIVL